jgi:phage shock protein PspC (stress-responsive transcriptional regulator)
MKKTLTISISGFVFHIEEDGYERLSRYMEAIKSHFRGFEGRDEVISDIEARIAELLQSKLSPAKEVITIEDIGEVIAVMGQPADFAMDSDMTGASASSTRLPKRLYRDPERKMLGGICAGLGYYFNIDPTWVRVIFLVSILISGFGLLVYLILWMVVPEARTTAENLEMRGEPVNISNLEKSLGDEVRDLRNRHGDRVRSGLGQVGRVLVRILAVGFGFFILLLGIALTVIYLSVLFRFPVVAEINNGGLHTFPLYNLVDRIFETDTDLRMFSTGLMVIFGIPLLMMLWAGIRLIFGIPRTKMVAGLAALAWVCALVITLIFGLKVANSFRGTAEFARQVPLKISAKDTLYVTMEGHLPLNGQWERSGMFYFSDARIAVADDDEVIHGIPLLKFKLSADSTGHINVATLARGNTTLQASETAEKVDYKWKQNGDTLVLSDNFTLSPGEKWRMQKTRVEVMLPEGTSVKIDKKAYPVMGYHKNFDRHDIIGTMYIMSNEGLARKF